MQQVAIIGKLLKQVKPRFLTSTVVLTSYNTAVNELVPTAIPCEDSLVAAGHCSGTPLTPTFTQVLTAVEHTGVEGACMVPPQRCNDCPEPPEVNVSTPFSNQTDCPESLKRSKLLCNR